MTSGIAGRPATRSRVDRVEATVMLVTLTVLKVFLAAPERLAREGQTAAWAVPVISALLSIIWLWPLVSVLNAHPGMDIVQITRRVAGGTAAIVTGLFYYCSVVGLLATGLRQGADAFISVTLPLTPLYFLLGVAYVVVLCVPLWGIESLARTSLIGGIYSYSMMALLPIALLFPNHYANVWNADQVFPLLGPGVIDLLKAGVMRQSMYFEIFSLGFLAPRLRRRTDAGGVAAMSLGFSVLALSMVEMGLSMVFPYPSLRRVPFAYLRATRIVGFGRFFQRLDVAFVANWLVTGLLGAATGVYVAGLTLVSTFGLGSYKALLLTVTATIAALGAYCIPNLGVCVIAEYDILRPFATVLLDALPISLLLLDRMRRKRTARDRVSE